MGSRTTTIVPGREKRRTGPCKVGRETDTRERVLVTRTKVTTVRVGEPEHKLRGKIETQE